MTLTPEEHERRRAAYEAERNDKDAAEKLGIARGTFQAWRAEAELPPKGGKLPPEEHKRRLAVYKEAASDNEAAEKLGMSRGRFQAWRDYYGLPPKNQRQRLTPEEHARRRAAYEAAPSDGEAAKLVGISIGRFHEWRQDQELPAKRRPVGPLPDDEVERRLAAYEASETDEEAWTRMGLTKEGYTTFRRTHGLSKLGDEEFVRSSSRVRRLRAERDAARRDEEAAADALRATMPGPSNRTAEAPREQERVEEVRTKRRVRGRLKRAREGAKPWTRTQLMEAREQLKALALKRAALEVEMDAALDALEALDDGRQDGGD